MDLEKRELNHIDQPLSTKYETFLIEKIVSITKNLKN
jgi:hypothetical protein